MRVALKIKAPQRQQVARFVSYPAPVGGWNARDPLANMRPEYAVKLENWFPQPSYCELRGGYKSHATGMTGVGKTLMTYNAQNGAQSMFCTTSSGTFNVTFVGAVGSSVLARTNGKHQWTMFADGTNNWLIACNGVDKPAYYDGTTWIAVDNTTTPSLSGVPSTELVQPLSFKGRLMFVRVNSASFWYLPAGAAGGTLSEFNLGGEFTRGGFLQAIGSWTLDAGDGMDDLFVAVSSEGEAVVYKGTNPANAASWAKVGKFFVGRPLGRRCLIQYGGDLVIITQNGVFPFSAAIQTASVDYKMALSFLIESAFTEAAREYGNAFGWRAITFPPQNALIVNVPIAEEGVHHQYVMNTITKAWCKFTGWDAEDFGVMGSRLFFTRGDAVYEAWTGRSDNNANIVAFGKQAFNYFGSMTQRKKFKLYRPVLTADDDLEYLTGLDVDFEDEGLVSVPSSSSSTAAKWDSAIWDQSLWAGGFKVIKQWTSPTSRVGYCAAAKVKVASKAVGVRWLANEISMEFGGPI
jgi:hypothetical protein